MAIKYTDYKKRVKLILDGIEGIDQIIVGAPYSNKIEESRTGKIYITTKSTIMDDIRLNTTINNNGHVSLEHEMRLNILVVKSSGDGRQTENMIDDIVTLIIARLEDNATLSHGANAGIAEIAYPESVQSEKFGSDKTMRVISLKIIRNS